MQPPVSNTPKCPVSQVGQFRDELGPFVVAAETTRMATAFTDGADSNNPIIFANDAFLALTGFTYTQIIGLPLNSLLSDVTDAPTVSSIRAALNGGVSGSWDMPCRRADGREFLAAVFLSPVRDKSGTLRQNVLTVIDLAVHAEGLLVERDAFHAVYEHAPGFIAITEGPDLRFTFANASYKKFVGRENLVGLTVAEALPEAAEQGFVDLLDDVYRTGTPFVGRGVRIDIADPVSGETRSCYSDFIYQAVRNARGDVVGLFCEGYDVTEQRETARTLANLQSDLIHVSRVNAMGTMASTLAHELNQPLSAVANYTAGAQRLIGAGALSDPRLVHALEGIEEASTRAADIIRNLRELTRRHEPARTAFNLDMAVRECVRLVKATAVPSISVETAIPDDLTVVADRVQIQQVIINLIRNACDAVSDCPTQTVLVGAKLQGDDYVISVRDSGSGVSLEAAQDLFASSESIKIGGMGLGLSISKSIVAAHHGRIWIERSCAAGTEFCFSLPLEPPASQDGS